LLAALALLPPGLEWRFVHIGGGTLSAALIHQARRLGLSRKIEWRGALAQPDVLAAYRRADLFVLASKVAKDGDRDGLPNVLIEAQSQRLVCVATGVSGIPELIEQGVTGLLEASCVGRRWGTPCAQQLRYEIWDRCARGALWTASG